MTLHVGIFHFLPNSDMIFSTLPHYVLSSLGMYSMRMSYRYRV